MPTAANWASAVYTSRPFGHVGRGLISGRGMYINFAALARLPLVDATAISFASPFITVALAASFSRRRSISTLDRGGGRVRRRGGDAVSDLNVVTMAAGSTARHDRGGLRRHRRVHQRGRGDPDPPADESETTASIVFYFSLICTLAGAASLPFGWICRTRPNWPR